VHVIPEVQNANKKPPGQKNDLLVRIRALSAEIRISIDIAACELGTRHAISSICIILLRSSTFVDDSHLFEVALAQWSRAES
jgi:hypothetical protein